jgi:hypothetical protein
MSGVQLKLNSKRSKKKKSLESSAFSSGGHGDALSMGAEDTETTAYVIPVRHSSREQFIISTSRPEHTSNDTSLASDNPIEEIVDANQYGLIPMGSKPTHEQSHEDTDSDMKDSVNTKSSTGLFGNVTKPKSVGPLATTTLLSNSNNGDSNLSRQLAFDTTVTVEDIDPTSEAYKKIPVSEFGKAMLRGMGWTGPDDNESEWMQKEQEKLRKPRENLLGLGAKSTVQKKKEEEAKRKAHEVSGNDKTLTAVTNKSKSDLKDDKGDSSGIPGSNFDKSEQRSAKKRRTDNGDSTSSHKSKKSDKQSDKKTTFWLRAGIQVRIVSKKVAGSSNDGKKANVLDVQVNGICTLSLHSDGKVIDGVKQKYLETVIPSTGKQCMVVKGAYSGQTGRLHEKDKEKETVVIELNDEMEYVVLKMDDVSALH